MTEEDVINTKSFLFWIYTQHFLMFFFPPPPIAGITFLCSFKWTTNFILSNNKTPSSHRSLGRKKKKAKIKKKNQQGYKMSQLVISPC